MAAPRTWESTSWRTRSATAWASVERDRAIGAEGERDEETAAGPARAHVRDLRDAGNGAGLAIHLRDDVGVYGVHEAVEHVAADIEQDVEDGDGDEQAAMGSATGTPRATRTRPSGGERGDAVGAGVLAVGDEGGAVEAAAHADLVLSENLVAGEADQRGDDAEADLGRLGARDEALIGGERGGGGANGDDEGDEGAGEVFGAVEAVGEAVGRRAAGEDEGDPEGGGGEYVAEVVQGVGEQAGAVAEGEDAKLDGGDDEHAGGGDGDDAQPLLRVGRDVVGVGVAVSITVAVIVAVAGCRAGIVRTRGRVSCAPAMVTPSSPLSRSRYGPV